MLQQNKELKCYLHLMKTLQLEGALLRDVGNNTTPLQD